jgi:hypothetical protein
MIKTWFIGFIFKRDLKLAIAHRHKTFSVGAFSFERLSNSIFLKQTTNSSQSSAAIFGTPCLFHFYLLKLRPFGFVIFGKTL